METLYDVMMKKRNKEKRAKEFFEKTGSKKVPNHLITPGILVVKDISPKDLLTKGGYKRINKGYVRNFEKIYRYHAYILDENRIEIHTDKIKLVGKHGVVHIPSVYKVKEEKKRLKKFFSKIIPQKSSPKTVTKMQFEEGEKKILTTKEMQEALKKLERHKKTEKVPLIKRIINFIKQ